VNPDAVVIEAASPITPDDTVQIRGKKVLAIEDGPTLTQWRQWRRRGVHCRHNGSAAAGDRPAPCESRGRISSPKQTYKKCPKLPATDPLPRYAAYGPKQRHRDSRRPDRRPAVNLVLSGTADRI